MRADHYHSARWQVLEERETNSTPAVVAQNVWSLAYVDALVLRDRNADRNPSGNLGQAGSGLEERLYAQQDANWNVTSLANASGAVVERFVYDAYGSVMVLNASWNSMAEGNAVPIPSPTLARYHQPPYRRSP